MTKLITREEYEQFLSYKSIHEELDRVEDRLFNLAKNILGGDNENWLFDYFYNDHISVTELFEHLDIDIK